MNYLSGRIILKESGVGIPDLLVVVYDVDPGAQPEELATGCADPVGREEAATTTSAAAVTVAAMARRWAPAVGDRLGSRLTAADGSFRFDYEDEEFQIRNPNEKRPDLLLMILAPEEPGVDIAKRVLFVASEVCGNAGRTEERLIRIPEEALKAAGMRLPIDAAVVKEQSKTAIGQLTQAITFQQDVEAESRKIASAQVAKERSQQQEIVDAVEARVFESLTGVSAPDAARLRIVMPGEPATRVMNASINKTIASVNSAPIAGYLVLNDAEAERFSDGLGGFRQDVPAEEIEPILYRSNQHDPARPRLLIRDDPLESACRLGLNPDPFGDDPEGGATPPENGELNGPNAASEEADPLPKFILRLIEPLAAPEDVVPQSDRSERPTTEHGQPSDDNDPMQKRPTKDDVQQSVQNLQLKPGPADVARLYDFKQLQIAFDFVWQHAIDDEIIETTKTLASQIAAAGGDPIGAVTTAANPIAGLRREAANVIVVQGAMRDAGVKYRAATHLPTNGSAPMTSATNPQLQPLPAEPTQLLGKRLHGSPHELPDIHSDVFNTGTPKTQGPPPPQDLLDVLDDLLEERYKFEIFAPGSTNFGLVVTYRQKWDPITYQVGDLVKSLTLAPKEMREVTSKRVVKTEITVKEMQENQRSRKDETNQTLRDEAEIVDKAQVKTHFDVSANANYSRGGFSGGVSTTWSRDTDLSSQETKKSFHEAVLKSAQEFKDTRKIEVDTKTTEETEFTESIKLGNPNDELTVTYLFYELQRRFRVTEHIHRLAPVVLVALDVPNPNRKAIDNILLSHAWIINRVLLDDRYRKPLEFLCTTLLGAEQALGALKQTVDLARIAVTKMQNRHADIATRVAAAQAAFDAAVIARAHYAAAKARQIGAIPGDLPFNIDDKLRDEIRENAQEDLDFMRQHEEPLKEQYENAVRAEKDMRMRLDSEIAALAAAQEAYAKAKAEHSNQLLQIAGLRVHFKENMLYYMQAIWRYTFRDQMLFTLSKIKVPKLTAPQRTYSLAAPQTVPVGILARPGEIVLEVRADVQFTPLDPDTEPDFVSLPEIADLEPIDFLGNCAVLRLKESNPLTDYMMVPYIDTALGIHDPDYLGSWTPERFAEYARCLRSLYKRRLDNGEITPTQYQALENQLKEQYRQILSNPRPSVDDIIVPTTSLYIEALPGAHPLLENFKLAHRAIDVKKAQAETRKIELENLRYAGRLLDKDFEDPDIDRKIHITGAAPAVVVPPET